MKKIAALILTLIMVLGLFAACGEVGGGDNNDSVVADPFGVYDPKITVTYAMPFYADWVNSLRALDQSIEDNVWTDAAKKYLGIKLVLIDGTTEVGSYYERLTSQIAAGNFPDFANVGTAEMSVSYYGALYRSNLLADLTEVFEKSGSADFKSTLAAAGDAVFLPCTFGGKKMGLPMTDSLGGQSNAYWYIRKDWLDNLNMSAPTNLEELFAVARAFTVGDPDGNGENDTVGIACSQFFKSNLSGIFNGFGAYPDMWIEDGSNHLVYGSIQPEMKDAVEYIRELFSNGYMMDYTAASEADMDSAVRTGRAGIFGGRIFSASLASNAKKVNPAAEFVAVPVFGQSSSDEVKLSSALNSYFYYAVNADSRHPEAVVKLCNLFIKAATDKGELYEELIAGPDGTDRSSFAPVRMLSITPEHVDGKTLREEMMDAFETRNPSGITTPYYRDTVYPSIIDYLDNDNINGYANYLIFGENGTAWQIEKFRENVDFVINSYIGEQTASMKLYSDTLYEVEYTGLSAIIIGEEQLDYFDVYVDSWKTGGGDDITREVNEWYATVTG